MQMILVRGRKHSSKSDQDKVCGLHFVSRPTIIGVVSSAAIWARYFSFCFLIFSFSVARLDDWSIHCSTIFPVYITCSQLWVHWVCYAVLKKPVCFQIQTTISIVTLNKGVYSVDGYVCQFCIILRVEEEPRWHVDTIWCWARSTYSSGELNPHKLEIFNSIFPTVNGIQLNKFLRVIPSSGLKRGNKNQSTSGQ